MNSAYLVPWVKALGHSQATFGDVDRVDPTPGGGSLIGFVERGGFRAI